MKQGKQRITKQQIEKELRNVEQRIKTIERRTGAQISLNKDEILSSANRAKTLQQLKNISWSAFKEGRTTNKDFLNMTVSGKQWKAGEGLSDVKTEIQGKDAVDLLKAAAKRERITGQREKIRVDSEKNIRQVIDWFNYYKNEKDFLHKMNVRKDQRVHNFAENLEDMKEFAKTKEQKDALDWIAKKAEKAPKRWHAIIDGFELYKMAGVRFYESKDEKVVMKENFTDIWEILEKELGEVEYVGKDGKTHLRKKKITELDEEDLRKLEIAAQRRIREKQRKKEAEKQLRNK